jgi:hypothetical protein
MIEQGLAQEAINLLSFLTVMRYKVEEVNTADPWFINIRSINSQNVITYTFHLRQLTYRCAPYSPKKPNSHHTASPASQNARFPQLLNPPHSSGYPINSIAVQQQAAPRHPQYPKSE